jgi:hypothetical protein
MIVVLAGALSAALTQPLAAQAMREPQAAAAAERQTVVGRSVVHGSDSGLSGIAVTPDGQPLGNVAVRARNLLTNEVNGSAQTSEKGEFAILNLQTGNYVVEIVNDDGSILGTSAFVSVTAGAMVTGLTITAATGVLTATGTGLLATLGAITARSVTAAAAAAGVAGMVVPPDVPIASPSR